MASNFYFINSEKTITRIEHDSLLYIFVENGFAVFVLSNKRRIISSSSLKAIEDDLPDHFIKINRSTLVNGYQINEYNMVKRKIHLDPNIQLTVSTRKLISVKTALIALNRTLTG